MNGCFIHFHLYAEGKTNAEHFVITTAGAPEYGCEFQINDNFTVALVNYNTSNANVAHTYHNIQQYELWYLHQPSFQLRLPNYNSFLTGEEREMISLQQREYKWLLDTNPNSQYLLGLYCKPDTGHANNFVEGPVRFVLVFTGFSSSEYLHRITLPANANYYDGGECRHVDILIIGSGKNAKTVLTAQTQDPYQFFVYDLSSGQTLLRIPLSRYHDKSGQYLHPNQYVLTREDYLLGGVNVIRIDCKEEKWTASTTFAACPHVEEYEEIRLLEVTESQTLWKVDEHDLIICDYLLNDFNFW